MDPPLSKSTLAGMRREGGGEGERARERARERERESEREGGLAEAIAVDIGDTYTYGNPFKLFPSRPRAVTQKKGGARKGVGRGSKGFAARHRTWQKPLP